MFLQDGNALVFKKGGEIVRIESWGKNALRLRATKNNDFTGNLWALCPKDELPADQTDAKIEITENRAIIKNGSTSMSVSSEGIITYYKNDEFLMREYFSNYGGTENNAVSCFKRVNREYKPYLNGDYKLTLRFEPIEGEKIYGMGVYQNPYIELKGTTLELAQRNAQTSIPFEVSNKGYGLLWNNPAVGHVTFGKNMTEWSADASREFDLWITTDESPKAIIENYTAVVGRAPEIDEDLLGLWQCKLRYRTQDEVLTVARKYQELGIKIDVLVIDFFHWTLQGEWKFDKEYWPDVKAMVDELHSYGIKIMVSVWPSVDRKSENFYPMADRGLLMRTEKGAMQTYDYQGDCVVYDATNPEARKYVWDICKKNYYDYGIDMFWLDNAEPDLTAYDFDNYRYYLGPGAEVSCIYPRCYAQGFFEGEKEVHPDKKILNLLRCGWVGSQKYGTLLWSGDVYSTFEALQNSVRGGLDIGLAGIPWWTTDIGGFMNSDVNTDYFKELLVRWYEWAVFTPILRLHGERGPLDIEPLDHKDWGSGYLHTGHANEIWSYGEEVQKIMTDNLKIRWDLKDYIKSLYDEASANGSPLMRTMFYEFPEDEKCWDLDDQYMFGSEYLVAPVMYEGMRERQVYLPAGQWEDIRDGKVYEGGQTITAAAPIESIPVFKKK